MCEELKTGMLDYQSRKVNEKSTYMGIPIEQIVIMYDYLKNHDGAIDGGFSEGFLAGARYAAAEIQEGMLKAAERAIISGPTIGPTIGLMGRKNGKGRENGEE